MCGIAGFVSLNHSTAVAGAPDTATAGASPLDAGATLKRMCDAMRHRGPDNEGFFADGVVALGMRRLSIIDLSTGHQPIHNEDKSVWVVFNGEIYNYRELRAELEREGHLFYTSSDTETIVHGYEQWGEGVFERLRGMFAIAIWNSRTRTLLLGRDRAGQKPLYYAEAGGRLYFGSEAKCLLVSPDVDRRVDVQALDHFLAYLYTPRDRSIFRGTHKLLPGHFLRVEDGRVSAHRYWQLPIEQRFEGSEAEALEALEATLSDAVRAHMISDVPLGAFLSGGIDSSTVVALMTRHSSRPVQTFSIGFDEPAFDELPHARKVAARLGTEHHEFVVRPNALDILDRMIGHFDEPFGDSSAIPTWYVSEMARRHVTVVLSGDGGDELFGGYTRYEPHPRVAALDRLVPPAIARPVAGAAWKALPHGARGKNFLRHVARDAQGRYLDSVAFYHADERRAMLAPDLQRDLAGWDAERHFAAPFARLRGLPLNAQLMAFDFETYLPEDCLVKVDRMSMAHSIESRVPLLDNEVITFAAGLPAGMRVQKRLLKTLAYRLVSRELLDRPKQGFGVPIGHWFRGSLRDTFGDILGSPLARGRGYFDTRFVDRILAEHLSGTRDHSLRLWQLLVFELWHRQYVDAVSVAA